MSDFIIIFSLSKLDLLLCAAKSFERLFIIELLYSSGATKEEAKKVIEEDLKSILTGLARHLFGDVEMRWREDYFPFTEPSFELDIFFNGDWMEVLGCGVIHDEVMANAGKTHPTRCAVL